MNPIKLFEEERLSHIYSYEKNKDLQKANTVFREKVCYRNIPIIFNEVEQLL